MTEQNNAAANKVGHNVAAAVADCVALAREHAATFTLEYSDAEDLWHARCVGAGKGEWWEVKRYSTVAEACRALSSGMREALT